MSDTKGSTAKRHDAQHKVCRAPKTGRSTCGAKVLG